MKILEKVSIFICIIGLLTVIISFFGVGCGHAQLYGGCDLLAYGFGIVVFGISVFLITFLIKEKTKK